MNVTHFEHRIECEGLAVQYDLCCPNLPVKDSSGRKEELAVINEEVSYEQKIAAFEKAYGETLGEIDRLTNHADGLDYALSVSAGIIAGLIDIFFVGEWDFAKAKAISNEEINRKIIKFAHKHGLNKDVNRLDKAVEFLESKFPLPGDNTWKGAGINVSASTHHLDDFKHHPTFVGLICCILDQFRQVSTYYDRFGNKHVLPLAVDENGYLEGKTPAAKVSAGIINWCFLVARNRKGHLMSDMAGSKNTAGGGMGIPGGLLSTLRELAALPGFRDTDFALKLTNAYKNGIGSGKGQVDLGAFNSLFDGASSKFDMRTELAVKHELKRQSIPIVLNEVVVRTFYFVRHFIAELRETGDVASINWNAVFPFRNRTIVRMITISTGTMEVIDLADATIRSGGNLGVFVLRVNFVGVGRFAIACSADVMMGIKKERLEVAMASAETAKTAHILTSTIDGVETQKQQSQQRLERLNAEIKKTSNLKF